MKVTKEHLDLLKKNFRNLAEVSSEIINLESILSLPKGTEHFMSDIHGEYEAFDHILRNGSGVIKEKLKELFQDKLTMSEINLTATIIYYPEEKLELIKKNLSTSEYKEFEKIIILRLIEVVKIVARKYTRSKVRKLLPSYYAYIIEELLYKLDSNEAKDEYYKRILSCILELGKAEDFITQISYSIQRLVVNHLHIVGDIYDRGPYPDKIVDRLMHYHSVDIQWGNHDILWIGAASGDLVCIANVLRICARYDNLDIIEDRYGISLRSLLNLAEEFYHNDACKEFLPKVSRENDYSDFELKQISRIHKAIAIIQFKLEQSVIAKNPDFKLDNRLLLDKINYEKQTITINHIEYPLTSCNFPTVDRKNPYKLNAAEEKVIEKLKFLFMNSEKLHKHIEFIINKGAMYKIHNGNLLLHGCLPLNKDGSFKEFTYKNKVFSGRKLLDFFDDKVRKAFYNRRKNASDIFMYLWQGECSPLFGKKDMTTFERYFILDKSAHTEEKNIYYKFREDEKIAEFILEEFEISDGGHIINGHTPVKAKKGEDPIKANGKTIVIDGGMSKAYNKTTGHGGYTLTYNSYGLQLMKHDIFLSKKDAIEKGNDIVSTRMVVDLVENRKTIMDTDTGKDIIKQIEILKVLFAKYKKENIC